jgi:hypothetical protein
MPPPNSSWGLYPGARRSNKSQLNFPSNYSQIVRSEIRSSTISNSDEVDVDDDDDGSARAFWRGNSESSDTDPEPMQSKAAAVKEPAVATAEDSSSGKDAKDKGSSDNHQMNAVAASVTVDQYFLVV